MVEVIVLNRSDVRKLLPMSACIGLMENAFRAVSDGSAHQELRKIVPLSGESGDCMGLMPGSLADPACFGVKVASVFPGNFGTDLQTHQGMILLFERQRGRPIAIAHAGEITAIRTAAATAVATRALSRFDSRQAAILGYGEQAAEHVEALLQVRSIECFRVWGRSFERAAEFAQRMSSAHHRIEFRPAHTVAEATKAADIVCTLTAAATPILEAVHIAPGAHLNVVGSSVAKFREVTDEVVARSRLFVDFELMTRSAGGEFLSALASGAIGGNHIAAEVGSVLAKRHPGRVSDNEITMFKSLGMPAEDLFATHYVYEQAKLAGAGQAVEF